MSSVNVRRVVDNIRANTTVYTPIVELIVNGIQATEELNQTAGSVSVRALRQSQEQLLDDGPGEVTAFEVEDNGIGFTEQHRESFDTLYTDRKIAEGGKGFGRFTCLKYFENVYVKSVYRGDEGYMLRRFRMGKDQDIIVDEQVTESDATNSGTLIELTGIKKTQFPDRKLQTIAKNLVERLLPFFITKAYQCPRILLSESDGSGGICLNDFVTNEVAPFVQEVDVEQSQFILPGLEGEEHFWVRVFRLYSPGNLKSRISLVAHKREVSGSVLHKYIPEFEDEFYEKRSDGSQRNYILKAYVFGAYLDRNVSVERGGFEFRMENDLFYGIAQMDVEGKAATVARDAMDTEMRHRRDRKMQRVRSYVDEEAPWHKDILGTVDLAGVPYHATEEEIEEHLQREKFAQERTIKKDVAALLSETSFDRMDSSVADIVKKISHSSKNDLIHYIAQRRAILDLFRKSLEVDEAGHYSSEGVVHDIVFPRGGDTERTAFQDHNLWIVDERLNFTTYVSSDVRLGRSQVSGRPDLLAYGRRVLFRGDNEESNPVTVFEFKKPKRDDFVRASRREDPVQQIIRYVNDVRDGRYGTPEGREMSVADNTPFYGFVVCDLTKLVRDWLEREKNFSPMPDRLGYFQWINNINLYVEVLSWDKLLRDAEMRNRVLFQKLGI